MFYDESLIVCQKNVGQYPAMPTIRYVPLDPQPSCKTCQAYEPDRSMCKDMGQRISPSDVKEGWFCSYWQPSESKGDEDNG